MRSAEFLTDPTIADVATGNEAQRFKLLGPLVGYSAALGVEFVVPEGFEFEESIPFLAWSVARPLGSTRRGAAVHDWAYRNRSLTLKDGTVLPVTRAQADALYREFLLVRGTPKWRANARWAFLRIGGFLAWAQSAKRLAILASIFLLPSCSQPILGLNPAQRDEIYVSVLTAMGYRAYTPLIYGVRRSVTSAKNPQNVIP